MLWPAHGVTYHNIKFVVESLRPAPESSIFFRNSLDLIHERVNCAVDRFAEIGTQCVRAPSGSFGQGLGRVFSFQDRSESKAIIIVLYDLLHCSLSCFIPHLCWMVAPLSEERGEKDMTLHIFFGLLICATRRTHLATQIPRDLSPHIHQVTRQS